MIWIAGNSCTGVHRPKSEMSSLSPLSDTPLQHIVKLKDNIDMDAHVATFNNARGNSHIVHHKWDPRFLSAYMGEFLCSRIYRVCKPDYTIRYFGRYLQ